MTTTTTTPAPGRYVIDPARTSITVATKHLFGLGSVAGTFTLKQADLVVGDPLTATTLTAVVDAGSFDSKNTKRDEIVAGPKFLDAANHPDITVTLTGATQTAGAWTGVGTVTAHGVSAPVQITLHEVEQAGGQVVLSGSTRIDRYAHGVTAAKGMAARWLDLTLSATATMA